MRAACFNDPCLTKLCVLYHVTAMTIQSERIVMVPDRQNTEDNACYFVMHRYEVWY